MNEGHELTSALTRLRAAEAEIERLAARCVQYDQIDQERIAKIKRLTAQLKTAVWSDSEECKLLGAEVERLNELNTFRVQEIARLQHAVAIFAEKIERLQADLVIQRDSQVHAVNEMLKAEVSERRLREVLSWLAGHEPELVEQAREKYRLEGKP